jgi:hypothetical protein
MQRKRTQAARGVEAAPAQAFAREGPKTLSYAIVRGMEPAQRVQAACRGVESHWCRFGDRTLVWSAAEAWPAMAEQARELGLGLEEVHEARGSLYLVVQVGETFLRANPGARVALSLGRYLAV